MDRKLRRTDFKCLKPKNVAPRKRVGGSSTIRNKVNCSSKESQQRLRQCLNPTFRSDIPQFSGDVRPSTTKSTNTSQRIRSSATYKTTFNFNNGSSRMGGKSSSMGDLHENGTDKTTIAIVGDTHLRYGVERKAVGCKRPDLNPVMVGLIGDTYLTGGRKHVKAMRKVPEISHLKGRGEFQGKVLSGSMEGGCVLSKTLNNTRNVSEKKRELYQTTYTDKEMNHLPFKKVRPQSSRNPILDGDESSRKAVRHRDDAWKPSDQYVKQDMKLANITNFIENSVRLRPACERKAQLLQSDVFFKHERSASMSTAMSKKHFPSRGCETNDILSYKHALPYRSDKVTEKATRSAAPQLSDIMASQEVWAHDVHQL